MHIRNLRRVIGKIESGEWVGDIPQMGDLRLKVRGLGSSQYQDALKRLSAAVPITERHRDGSLTREASVRVAGEAAAEGLLLDWANLTDDDGKGGERPVPYSPERARQWLTDPEYRHFADVVFWAAQVVEHGREAATEATAKNSERPSAQS